MIMNLEEYIQKALAEAHSEGRQELIQELKEMQLGEILDLINSEPI